MAIRLLPPNLSSGIGSELEGGPMNRHLRRLASITIGVLTFCVLVVPLTAQAAVAPAASGNGRSPVSPAQKAEWQRATAEGLAITATARALEPYLVRAPDGTL